MQDTSKYQLYSNVGMRDKLLEYLTQNKNKKAKISCSYIFMSDINFYWDILKDVSHNL